MKSSFRNAAAAVITALALSLSAYAAEPQSWSDSLRLTSPGATTVSALEAFAKANSGTCRGERSAEEAAFHGNCFGLGESRSKFSFNGDHVEESEVLLTDRERVADVKAGLRLVCGEAKAIPNFGKGWLVGGERWRFDESEEGILFVRELHTDAEREIRRFEERMRVLDRF